MAVDRPILVLAAHGSSKDASVGAQVREVARWLAEKPPIASRFAAVTAAFLKNEPFIRDAVADQEVVVLPFLMANGYFAREVIPREVSAGNPAAGVLQPPLGTDLRLVDALDLGPGVYVIVGHGTERDPESRQSVFDAVDRLQSRGTDVHAAFLDDAPRLADVLERLRDRAVTILPWFAADGPHVRDDIVGAHAGPEIVVWPAVGTTDAARTLLVELAIEGWTKLTARS